MRWVSSFILVCVVMVTHGQEDKLANRYYEQGDYEKALDIYLDVYKKNPSPFFYQRITNSYIAIEAFDDAIGFVKKDMRKRRGASTLQQVDLIFLHRKNEDDKNAQKSIDQLLDDVVDQPGRVQTVARLLSDKGLYDVALKAYETAEKSNPNMRLTYQKAQIYAELGQLEDMYDSYIGLIEESAGYLATVKNLFSRSLSKDPNDPQNEYVKASLIKRIQKNSNENLADVLIHVFMHEENFSGALKQAIARDRRRGGDEHAILRLGMISAEKGDYETAYQAFDYIIERKPASSYNQVATVERLKTRKIELDNTPNTPASEYDELAKDARAILDMNQWMHPITELALTLADVEAFHRGNHKAAIADLNRLDDTPRISERVRIQGKLLLGDINLFAGKYLNARLAYAQAEKLAGDQPLGDEAKLRGGKVAYFQADFSYALSTFDVLKSSTSKHTANNAMKLSLLIRENTMLDTSYEAMTRFAQADLKYFRKRYDDALRELRLLINDFPQHSLHDEILFLKAKILYDTQEYATSSETLSELLSLFPDGILADEALLMMGKIHLNHLGNAEKASTYFEQLITVFPNSYFVSEARRLYRTIRGDINF